MTMDVNPDVAASVFFFLWPKKIRIMTVFSSGRIQLFWPIQSLLVRSSFLFNVFLSRKVEKKGRIEIKMNVKEIYEKTGSRLE